MFATGNILNKNATHESQTRGSGEAGPTNPWHGSRAGCFSSLMSIREATEMFQTVQ